MAGIPKNMNIGIDIRPLMTAPRTGVGEYTYELLDAIFKIDRHNRYFLLYNSWNDVSENIPKWEYENVKILAKRMPNKLYNGSMRLFGRPRLDAISTGLDIFFAPNLNFISLSSRTKFILTVHDLSFHFFPEFSTGKQFWWHKIVAPQKQCERANLILAPSENTGRDIVDYYGISPEKIKVIYPGIKPINNEQLAIAGGEVKKKYDLPDEYILFLGTVEPRKNIIGLIEAFELFSLSAAQNYALVIAGAPGWKNAEIFTRAKNSKVADKIKFVGFIEAKDKPALYAAAQMFVYPSFYEGFGFPVLEAMLAGTPVITSNRSSLPEVAGSAACLIDPVRPEQIALAMSELATKPNLRNWHIEKGRAQTKKFTWEKAAKEWLEIIK